MTQPARYIVNCLWIALLVAFIVFFTSIFVYVLFSFILSMVLYPLTQRVEKSVSQLHIGNRYPGEKTVRSLAALLAVCIVLLVVVLMCRLLLPALSNEIRLLTTIDYNSLSVSFDKWLYSLQTFLHEHQMIEPDETVVGILVDSLKRLLNLSAVTSVLGGAVNFVVSSFIAVFAILFLTFFFVRDRGLFKKGVLAIVPENRAGRVGRVVDVISGVLARYFSGLMTEVGCMMVLLSLGMLLLGVKGAVLFGVLGGLLNVIPYLGPVLGALICCILGIINAMSGGDYTEVWPVVLKIASVFVVANVIDNVVLQPWIYSEHLEVHAVEIFLVMLLSGMIGGILGVLLAIPVYMILRTIILSVVRPETIEEKTDDAS